MDLEKSIIRDYKRKLKNLIKSFSSIRFFTLVKLINLEIENFSRNFSVLDNWNKISIELDLYIYKIIWRLMIRLHPKRSRTWIFSKYWKNFGGAWRFFCFDNFDNTYFLKMHSFLLSRKIIDFPASLNIFDLNSSKKFLSLLINNYENYFNFSFGFLYRRQMGLCEFCHSPLVSNSFKLVRINYSANFVAYNMGVKKEFYLIHSYCCFPK